MKGPGGKGSWRRTAWMMARSRREMPLVTLAGVDVELVRSLIGEAFLAKLLMGLVREVAVVEVLDGLLKSDGDQKTENDGGDVDEEVAPGGGSVMCGMDVEHGCGLLGRAGRGGCGGGGS